MSFFPSRIFLLGAALLLLASPASGEPLRAGGTGSATGLLVVLNDSLRSAGRVIRIHTVPSLGSSGGIAAVGDGVLDFCVTARPLKEEERIRGLEQKVLARTPFVLATSSPNPQSLPRDFVAKFFSDIGAKWAAGAPVRVVLRPRSDSDTGHLGSSFPGMSEAIEAVRSREDIPLAASDQDNLDLAERIPGSLVAASLTQIVTERRRVNVVAVDGVVPSLASFESGQYGISKELYLVYKAVPAPEVVDFLQFLETAEARAALRSAGALSP